MEAIVDEKDNKPRQKCMYAFIPFIVCLFFAVVLVPLGVMFLRPAIEAKRVAAVESSISTMLSSNSIPAQTSHMPPPSAVPPQYAATIFDTRSWLDLDFNTTFTTEAPYGLSVMGLWSNWSDEARPNPFVSPLVRPLNAPIRSCSLDGWLTRHENGSMKEIKETLEHHYMTLTLLDFEEMAEAGLNYVRIPLPHWLVTPIVGEPYLPMVGWRYFLRALEWARQCGLRVEVQLLPGRSLKMVETTTRFLSQPRYENLVTMLSVVGTDTNLRSYGFEGLIGGVDLKTHKMHFGTLAEVCTEWPSQVQNQLSEWYLDSGTFRLERAFLKDVARSLVSVFEQGAGWVFSGWPQYRAALDAGVMLNFNTSQIDLWCDSGVNWGLMGLANISALR